MKKTCDQCGKELGLIKFRYSEGYICKTCYKIASQNFTDTVREKTLDEISIIMEQTSPISIDDDFTISAKIGNFLLIDKKRGKFYIANKTEDNKKTNIYRFSDIKTHEIVTVPKLTPEEIMKPDLNSTKVIKSISVRLSFTSDGTKEEIVIASTPMRLSSKAFKMSLGFAERISQEFDRYKTNG